MTYDRVSAEQRKKHELVGIVNAHELQNLLGRGHCTNCFLNLELQRDRGARTMTVGVSSHTGIGCTGRVKMHRGIP